MSADPNANCLTVGQLIEELSKFDKSLPVWTEGCDCHGEAASVRAQHGGTVLIERPTTT